MFFDTLTQMPELARKTGGAVFVVPKTEEVQIKNAIILKPESKTVITIEQIHEVLKKVKMRQTGEQFIIINPAEKLSETAANALLKGLEEPGEKVHFVLVTTSPSLLLPTILSRVAVYFLRQDGAQFDKIEADTKIKDMAKKLMVAKPAELPAIAEEIAKKKDGVRAYALKIIGVAIEMLYKTYFLTQKEVFLRKLPRFLTLYDNIAKNGHIKLHIVADLI